MDDERLAVEDVEYFAARLEHLGWATLTPFLAEDGDEDEFPPMLGLDETPHRAV